MNPANEVIWRYMSFTKFVDLLSTQTLFFARSDRFADPFEGSVPKAFHERRVQELIAAQASSSSPEHEIFAAVGKQMREYVFVNCWHMSDYESEALWKLYVQSGEGVAIKSTRNAVNTALFKVDDDKSVWSVPIKYIDFASDDPPVPSAMAPFRYKRKSFEHEKELRFIYYAPTIENGSALQSPDQYGLRFRVDLSELIQEIYVAPTAPSWFHNLTHNLCGKFELSVRVNKSALENDTPLFMI